MINNELKELIMLELTAPKLFNEYDLPLAVRQEIYSRYKENKSNEYTFEPIQDIELRNQYIRLYNDLDRA